MFEPLKFYGICINPIALRRAETLQSFGPSERKRIKGEWVHFQGNQLCHFQFHLLRGQLSTKEFVPLQPNIDVATLQVNSFF